MVIEDLSAIICRPLITEKSALVQQYQNAQIFEVEKGATKLQIKRAIEKYFNVKVISVKTMILPGKFKRYGRQVGKTRPRKKAIVKLAVGQTIEIFEA
jgi:large subunit ribosomal protein L23